MVGFDKTMEAILESITPFYYSPRVKLTEEERFLVHKLFLFWKEKKENSNILSRITVNNEEDEGRKNGLRWLEYIFLSKYDFERFLNGEEIEASPTIYVDLSYSELSTWAKILKKCIEEHPEKFYEHIPKFLERIFKGISLEKLKDYGFLEEKSNIEITTKNGKTVKITVYKVKTLNISIDLLQILRISRIGSIILKKLKSDEDFLKNILHLVYIGIFGHRYSCGERQRLYNEISTGILNSMLKYNDIKKELEDLKLNLGSIKRYDFLEKFWQFLEGFKRKLVKVVNNRLARYLKSVNGSFFYNDPRYYLSKSSIEDWAKDALPFVISFAYGIGYALAKEKQLTEKEPSMTFDKFFNLLKGEYDDVVEKFINNTFAR